MILIVDGMPLCYQAQSTVGHFCTKEKVPTGLRYGFMRSVASWSKLVSARKVIIAWDSPGDILKADGVEGYKSGREGNATVRDAIFAQMTELRTMISLTTYSQVSAPRYEADDLAATIARGYERDGEGAVIVTSDRDLFAAVSDKISVLLTANRERKLITPKHVKEAFGVMPWAVPMVKSLLGDVSDSVKGLGFKPGDARMGQVLACLNYSEGGEYEDDHDYVRLSLESKLNTWGISVDRFRSNLRVMSLHDVPREAWQITKGRADPEILKILFEQIEFASMLKRIDEFCTPQNQ